MTWPLRLSTQNEEGIIRVSKWIKIQVLLDLEELKTLFASLPSFHIYSASEPVNEMTAVISFEEFFQKYEAYIASLKEGKIPEEKSLRRYFSSVFTTTPDILYAIKVGEEKYLIKSLKPIVQLQAHQFFVSSIDQKVHPMVLGKDSITWGMQFSYPQIFQSPKSQDFFKVDTSEQFPNTVLFTNLVKWIRRNTTPTPLVIEGKKTFVPIRVGKKCMSWIHIHPQLVAKKIQIASLEGVHD